MEDRELVDALDDVWGSMARLGAELSEEQWKSPSDLPGWTVQDVYAHVIGIEEFSLGLPAPEVEVPDYPHVKNETGELMERWVEAMRTYLGAQVLDRFTTVTGERLGGLRALDDAGFGAESWTPRGLGTVRDLLPYRIFDSWVHEQDVRVPLGRPGGFDTPAATLTLERCRDAMGFVVGKKAGAPDGATVVFALDAPLADTFAVGIVDSRGALLDAVPGDPTVRVTTTGATFVRLSCGRATADQVEVTTEGDTDLAAAVLANLNFMF